MTVAGILGMGLSEAGQGDWPGWRAGGVGRDVWDEVVGRARVTICGTCRGGAGAGLAADVAADLAGTPDGLAEVRLVSCLLSCGRPLALAVEAPGKAVYLFAGVDASVTGADVAAFVRLFEASRTGEVEDARPCGALRFHLAGRIPA